MVPEGWTATKVGEHVDLLSGFAFTSSNYSSDPDDIRLLRGDNIAQGSVRWRRAKRWPSEESAEFKKFLLNVNDLVIAMDRTWIGDGLKVARIKEADLPCLLVQRVSRLRALSSIDQDLLRYLISGYHFEHYVKSVQTETAVPHISAQHIKDFEVLLPPLSEQRKIAEILSTWDRAIETTEALLENARTQKRALMQQLLTGKRRFPEFEGQEWREVRLGDVGVISSAGVDKKSDPNEQPVRLLNFLDVFRRDFICNKELDHWVTAPAAKISQCGVRRGDIFFTPSSETRKDIAITAVATEDMPEVVYSYHVVRFRLIEDWDHHFRAFVFQTDDFRRQAYRLADGSGQRYVISQDNFRKMDVTVPPLAEQKKIGEVLLAAANEVERLRNESDHLRAEKKALMQQLLTGKRRVKI